MQVTVWVNIHTSCLPFNLCAFSETSFKLPEPWYDLVALKFSTSVDRHGHHQPPEVFFGGVVYGVSSNNPHNLEVSVL